MQKLTETQIQQIELLVLRCEKCLDFSLEEGLAWINSTSVITLQTILTILNTPTEEPILQGLLLLAKIGVDNLNIIKGKYLIENNKEKNDTGNKG